MSDDQQKKYIDALLVERAGYQRSDRADRLAAVEAELKRVGYKDPEQPKQRQSRPQRNA
jgi:hypothetical protein